MQEKKRGSVPDAPLSAKMEGVTAYKTKKAEYEFDLSSEYVGVNLTSASGAAVSVKFIPAQVEVPLADGSGTEDIPSKYTVTVGGVPFSTGEKRCPGKIKTVIRKAIGAANNVAKKLSNKANRAENKTEKQQRVAAAKEALKLL